MKVLTPPNKPYMIALGTSHTNGDCDGSTTYMPGSEIGIVEKTAYMMLAEKLGLEIVNLGLSGCKNIDMLAATNELAHHGFLGDNCRLFILEPRMVDATVRIPINAIDDRHYKEAPNNSKADWVLERDSKNRGIIAGYGLRRGYSGEDGADSCYAQEVGYEQKVFNTYYINEDGNKINTNGTMLEQFTNTHSYVSNSPLEFFDHIHYIDAIKNIVRANHVNFAWQIVNSNDTDLNICKKLIENNSDIFDYFVGIVDNSNNLTQDLKCSCGHLNQQGHDFWYENTWEKVYEIIQEINH